MINEIMAFVSENAAEIMAASFIFLMIFYGYMKGFAAMLLGICGFLISIMLTHKLNPMISGKLLSNEAFRGFAEKQAGILFKEVLEGDIMDGRTGFLIRLFGEDKIESFLKDSLTELVTGIVVIIMMLIIMRIGSGILYEILKIFVKLPILNEINRLLGAASGAAESVLILWLVFFICIIFPGHIFTDLIVEKINNPDSWLSTLERYNILYNLFSSL